MKKLFSIIATMFSLMGCSKSDSDKPEILYPITFEVDNVSSATSSMASSSTTFSASADSALKKIGVLYYLVYDDAGKYVHQIQQLSTSPDFGVFSDQLKAGKYTIVLTASTADIIIATAPLNLITTKLKAITGSGDIFFNKTEITVTSEGLNQKIMLKRIQGYLELKSTAAIASNVAKITLSVVNEAPYFWCATELADLTSIEKTTVSKDVTSQNRSSFSIGKYVMNDQQLLSIQVSTYDISGVLLKSKTVGNIKIEKNKMMTMSANLTDLMSVGISVDLNDTWQVDTTSIPFQLY